MGWQSGLAGFQEVPGTLDPVLFRYPARSYAASILITAAIPIAVAWFIPPSLGPFRWIVVAALLALGGTGVLFGLSQILTHRHLEVHPASRRLVEIRRAPWGTTDRHIHRFEDISRIILSPKAGPTNPAEASAVVVVELANGSHVDLGNLPPAEAQSLADRLAALTGASSVMIRS